LTLTSAPASASAKIIDPFCPIIPLRIYEGPVVKRHKSALPPFFKVGTARCAVCARKAGATSGPKTLWVKDSGGFTAGDAAARRLNVMAVVSSCARAKAK
jgi:hypothetical protein